MSSFLAEIRQSCRSLWAQPTWTIAAVVCLAIGTGANTAAFSLINGVLLRPLPFEDPSRIVMIAIRSGTDQQPGPVSLDQFRDISAPSAVFQQLAIRTFLPVGVSFEGTARMVQAEFVSGNYFELLRVRPTAGRLFTIDADRPGAEAQAVLSHKLWQTRFKSDHSIVGKTVRVNGRSVIVSGVAPAGFVGAMRIIAADMWLPVSTWASFISPEATREAEARREFGLIGRLQPEVSLQAGREQLALAIQNQWPEKVDSRGSPAVLMEEATGFGVPPGVRHLVVGGSALVFGLMALLVSVAIANVAGLMLARSTGRRRDIAIRLALGASRARIVRRVLTESLILALVGASLGALLAAALPSMVTGLGPRLPDHLSFAVDVRPDWRTGVYAAVSAAGIAMLFGLSPARQAAGTNSNLALRESAGNTRTGATSRMLNIFVAGQIAVSTVLLATCLLLARTYLNTLAVDPGIDIRNTLAVSVDWSQTGLGTDKGKQFFEQLLPRVTSMPAVRNAALTRHTPLSPGARNVIVRVESSTTFTAATTVVTDSYFDTVRLPLLQGRTFGPLDTGREPVAIINETMARQLASGTSAIGRRFSSGLNPSRHLEVVGVVKDAKHRSLSEAPTPMFYEPFGQTFASQMTLLVRSNSDVGQLMEPIRREIQSGNPDLAAITIRTLEDQFEEAAAPSRQRAVVLMVLCAIALTLSVFGLFGVMSYSVRQRVRELGIRIAVGASPAHITMIVMRHACLLVGTGCSVGLIAALFAGRMTAVALYGVSAYDPVTVCIVVILLAVVAGAAAYLPARWAVRVDPMQSLRAE